MLLEKPTREAAQLLHGAYGAPRVQAPILHPYPKVGCGEHRFATGEDVVALAVSSAAIFEERRRLPVS